MVLRPGFKDRQDLDIPLRCEDIPSPPLIVYYTSAWLVDPDGINNLSADWVVILFNSAGLIWLVRDVYVEQRHLGISPFMSHSKILDSKPYSYTLMPPERWGM